MVTRPYFTPLVEAQHGVLTDAQKLFAALRRAQAGVAEYPGWMFWKRYPTGRNYLVHAYDRTGRGTTLGGETPENEQRLEQFKQGQEEAKDRLKIAKQRVAEHGRFVKAARLNRFPRRAAAVVRALDQDPARKAVVVDAYALFAYELLLGVLFAPSLIEIDTLTVAVQVNAPGAATAENEMAEKGPTLVELLQLADRTFVLDEVAGSAISEAGLRVQVLDHLDAGFTTRLNPLSRSAPLLLMGPRQEPAPTIRETVIDQDGSPLEVSVPDPRVFAAHQYLLAESDEGSVEDRARNRYLADAVTEALQARQANLPPLEPFPNISGTARLGAILHDVVLAGTKQGALR